MYQIHNQVEMAQKEIISIATTNPSTIRVDEPLSDAIKLMAKEGFRRLPVVEHMGLVGILTATDVLRALQPGDMSVIDKPVSNFMTPNPVAVYRSIDLTEAVQIMFQEGLGSLPIVGEGSETLEGIVTERDLVKHFSEVADADLAEFITEDPITLPESSTTIGTIIDSMVDAKIRRAILVDKKKNVKGIVTSTDMMRFIANKMIRDGQIESDILNTKAKELMVKDVITVNVSQSMAEVAELFASHGMGGVPVVNDEGELVGIFTERDLLQVIALYQLM